VEWRFLYRGLKARYRDQRAELSALVRALSPGDVAVDVGANKGSYTWALARAVPDGRVVAFEPQPALAEYLTRACRSAGLANVKVEAAGLSAASGTLMLNVPGDGASSPDASFEAHAAAAGEARRIEVPTYALDDYFRDEAGRIGAIKIDVEGHEAAVLDGAAALIARHRPAVVMECEQRHLAGGAAVESVVGRLLGAGYTGWFVQRGTPRPIAEFDVRVHQAQGEGRFWDRPDYCNNFVFLATGRRTAVSP
jgi:FkbM family methyltransferase